MIFAIDPGTEESGWVLFDPDAFKIEDMGIWENEDLRSLCSKFREGETEFAMEMFENHGTPVGDSTFRACLWAGRFLEAHPSACTLYKRGALRKLLPPKTKLSDKAVGQAVRSRFPASGGGTDPCKGTKDQPGPLFGVRSHIWQALGIALLHRERPELGFRL